MTLSRIALFMQGMRSSDGVVAVAQFPSIDLWHKMHPWARRTRARDCRQMQTHWEHFEHMADIGVRGFGPTMASSFEQAALALTAVVTDPAGVRLDATVEVDCEAPDDELLLAQWLNDVVTQMALRRMVFGRFVVQLDGHRLKARAFGEPVSVARHRPSVEVKGATCTALRVARCDDGGWVAQTVVDV